MDERRKRIFGWMMFDWASQPYNTLLLTFIFGPYFAEIVIARLEGEGVPHEAARAEAQAWWGYGLTTAGLLIAFLAPVLGAIADSAGRRMPWIRAFSVLYVVGAGALWFSAPGQFSVVFLLVAFGIGLIGMEFATIFTNALLPALGQDPEIGRISGSGWAWGYVGGVLSLVIMLAFFAENAQGVTMLGTPPALGLDPAAREGTRFVGPFTALWYAVFMIPFFAWVKEPRAEVVRGPSVAQGLRDLWATLRRLPRNVSLSAYLGSSMFYRDALNGMYTFGGIYALGVLGWSVIDIGIFGIMAALTGALFAWLGGKADARFGPKPVIVASILALTLTAIVIVGISREAVFGLPLAQSSALPDILFYICGGVIGGAGGTLQAASRTMMVRQANPARMTEAFGLYALAGKATTFLAPAAIAVTTDLSGSQRMGVTPLIALFLLGLVLLLWVRPEGHRETP
ncbi:MFS transporter, UMF1 family [Meinhardsimonia xiamenensis]|jgi:UMF1 family MFS transporter|uniref:MFS transporter, UMF1 family n=1 Tax=Meinhardsimonia xiamenensis TaxID=990712 RepID=A0A1G8XY95_9RHOB|nr:MFS transporter [Meinhardsimonia xiamenensis]PRX37080.1 UMF1 family MFS transporter [Meinhardsimonia xiamenensis]SDJ95154.1 MFS transporter, UMF1 family [Meinhardsimonia xiamenensis]